MSVYGLMQREELISILEHMQELVKELYIHPVKELADKEIMQIAQTHGVIVDAGVYEFARAILRKAQEK
jgi:uncharacterized protein YaiI (UPF0178 family)